MRNHKDSNQKAWIALILGGCLAGLSLLLSLWKKKSCSSELSGKEKKLCLGNKKASIFQNKKGGNQSSEYQNPFEGKKVIFVENPFEAENADGVRGHLEAVGDSDYIPDFYTRVIKRGGDTILSAFALILLSPVFLFLSIAIFLDDPGPIFFTQKRLGKNKRYFPLHKFRSMKMCTPHDTPTHMLENPEQYITRVGKFIRAHSLDELPQIWDIFVGNMSIIGPRPGLWNQDLLTAERDKYNANDIQPGLSGWAQINGRDSIEIPDKAKLDGEYVEKMGFLMDLRCFFGTIFSVLRKDGVVEGGTGVTKNLCYKEKSKKEKSYSVLSEKSEREERCEHLIPPIKTMEIHENIKGFGRREFTKGKSRKELIGNIGFGESVEVDKRLYRKVLITGAGSYIGCSFKQYAKEYYPENFSIDELSLRDESWKEKNFSDYDVVYHVAGIAHADVGKVSEETKEKYYQINTDLSIAVAKKAKEEGVKCFVFMSSMIVYGDSAPVGKKKIIDENTVPNPANFYGDSKLQADVAVRELADDKFKVIVLRPPMIYGKDSKGNYPLLAKLAKLSPIFPDVKNERSMLYIENLCELLCQAFLLKSFKRNAVVLLPQNKEWVKTAEMVEKIAVASGKKIRTIKSLRPVLFFVGKVPGKISGLVNKAFGNNCYIETVSQYRGIYYHKYSLADSLKLTERKKTIDMQNQQPLVSIITAAYNCETTIEETIESVIAQTYNNWELLVVNDCSNDRTAEIVKRYEDCESRIKLVNLSKNGGAANARNVAVDNAQGRFIAILDSDDLWKPHKLENQIQFMIENDYGFTFTSYETFRNSMDKNRPIYEVPKKITYKQYLRNTIIGNLTVIIDKDKIPDFRIISGHLEDVLTWMYFLHKGYDAYGLNENLASYRVAASSKSGNKFKNAKRYFECLQIQPISSPEKYFYEICYIYNAIKKRVVGKIKQFSYKKRRNE